MKPPPSASDAPGIDAVWAGAEPHLYYEQIFYDPRESLRFLQWRQRPDQAEAIDGQGRAVPFSGSGLRWHYHPALEFTLIERGSGTCVIGNHLGRFSGPDLVVLGPNLPHCWQGSGASEGVCLQVDLSAGAFTSIPGLPLLESIWRRLGGGLRLRGATREAVSRQMRALGALPPMRRVALVWEMLALLSEAQPEESEVLSSRDFSEANASPYQRQMQAAVHWILERACQQQPELGELLRQIGMSRATFARHFRQHTGHSFARFVQEVRIVQAQRLLAESHRQVTEIAYACGYGNLASFHRIFQRATGCAPSEYRARLMRQIEK